MRIDQFETNRRVIKIIYKKSIFTYCCICQKREGTFYAFCGMGNEYGYHGDGKRIFGDDRRKYKTWKYNRKTQWKN